MWVFLEFQSAGSWHLTLKFSALEYCSSHSTPSKLQSPGNSFQPLSCIPHYFQNGKVLLIHKRFFSVERNWNLAEQSTQTGPHISQLKDFTIGISIWITFEKFHPSLITTYIFNVILQSHIFMPFIQMYFVEDFSNIMLKAWFILHSTLKRCHFFTFGNVTNNCRENIISCWRKWCHLGLFKLLSKSFFSIMMP